MTGKVRCCKKKHRNPALCASAHRTNTERALSLVSLHADPLKHMGFTHSCALESQLDPQLALIVSGK